MHRRLLSALVATATAIAVVAALGGTTALATSTTDKPHAAGTHQRT